jgi:thiol-disulfide isomerase/thioredoxin
MKKRSLFTILLFAFQFAYSQSVSIKTFKEFQPILSPTSDTVYVINFWATWCKPCVEELPLFEELSEQYKNEKLKVILVSLDFKSQFSKKLLPFVKQNKVKSEVILLDAPDYNSWIPIVNKNWSGSIPATIILHQLTSTHIFFEKELSNFKELENYILPIIKP